MRKMGVTDEQKTIPDSDIDDEVKAFREEIARLQQAISDAHFHCIRGPEHRDVDRCEDRR